MRSKFKVLSSLLFVALATSCVHRPQSSSTSSGGASIPQTFRATDPEPPQVVDQELETIPTEMNPLVEKWVAYFQGRGRPHMERYLARSTRYSTLMKRVLRQNGLPEDLIYIALIESGFSSRATSRAAAAGYWQFIRGTGRRYNLEINALVDERRDPMLSTQAAAEYFKGLYSVFGSWYLAMASYNVGENRVKREVMKHYTRDFWELARKKRFPRETINYVPKFIAAKMIGKNPEKYGFTDIEYEKPLEFETVRLNSPLNLKKMAELMGLEYEELKTLNPKFRGEVAPLKNASVELRVPLGMSSTGLAAAEKSFVDKVEFVADAGETETYRVRSGDSLYIIAKRYRTTVAWLRDVNDLKAGRKLRIGQRLQVPDRSAPRKKPVVVAKAEKKPEEKVSREVAQKSPEIVTPQGVFYVVQAGDTLSAIADDYDSSIRELRKMNNLRSGQVLQVGMKLKVPKDDGLPSLPESAQGAAVATASPAPATNEANVVTPVEKVELTATQVEQASMKDAIDAARSHVVRRGENLTTIAKKYGVSVQDLKKANNLGRRSLLKVGLKLTIPGSEPQARRKARQRIHVVRRGETLHKIAAKYSVSLDKLKRFNGLRKPSVVAGARLSIPM